MIEASKPTQNWKPGDCPMCGPDCVGGAHRNALAEDGVETSEQYQALKVKSAQPQLCPQCGNERDDPREDSIERMLVCADTFHSQSAQPQLPPLEDCSRCKGSGRVMSTSFVDSSKNVTKECYLCHGTGKLPRDLEDLERQLLSALAENESLKASLDEARSGCVAWECAVSSLKAHLQDRIAMKDESQPDIYLSILQSGVANVARDTKQIRDATWHRERLYAARAEKAEAERDQALGVIREYRWSQDRHRDCGPVLLNDDDRCPTCIKADALLTREEK